MGISSFLKKFLPSVKYGTQISKSVDSVEFSTEEIKQRIIDLDEKQEYLFWLNQMREGENIQETKKRVFMNLPKAEGRLREIQLALNYVLKKLKRVCDKIGIKFFLMSGTLLGAVRHGGFIPWDDDIDVGMMYDDFLKLQEALKDNSELYVKTYINYNKNIQVAKVRLKNGSTFFVDIFLFDYVSYDTLSEEERANKICSMISMFDKKRKEIFSKNFDMNTYCPVLFSDDKTEKELYDCYDKIRLQENYTSGKYITKAVCNPVFVKGWIYKTEDVFPFVEIEFEGEKYYTLKNYYRFLFHNFGDIWCFPRSVTPHHDSEVSSMVTDRMIYEIKLLMQKDN